MATEKSLVPKLRFEEFEKSKSWEAVTLNNISSLITKGTTPLDKSGRGDVNFIKIENISAFSGKVLNTSKITQKEHVTYLKRSQLEEKDILFSIAGTLGRVSLICKKLLPANTNQALAIIRLKEGDLNFLTTYLKGKAVTDFIRKNPTVGAQPNLSLEQVGNFIIFKPALREQIKIGLFFRKIDNLVSLQQQKITKLKNLKAAYLNDMFPKEGENVPKLRFANYVENWRKAEIRDLFIITRGNVLAANEVSKIKNEENPYPVYSSQTKYHGLMGYYSNYLFEDSITWTTDGANAGTVKYRSGKFYCTNVSGVLLSKNGFANKMIAELLDSIAWKHVSKVGNPKLMNNVMGEISLKIPDTIDEQTKIGEFFRNFDQQIKVQEDKLDKLNKMKQAYLNEMFV